MSKITIFGKIKKKLIEDKQLRNLLIIVLVGLLYFITLTICRHIVNCEIMFLKKSVIGSCDGWCVSHYLHYIVLAYVAPKYWLLLIIFGIIFEFIEMGLSKYNRFINGNLIGDTITNSLGVFTGLLIYNIFPTEVDIYNLTINRI